VMMRKKRRVEISFFEHERIVRQTLSAYCGVCRVHSELLTPQQAGALAQIDPQAIYQWVNLGRAHLVTTSSGQDWICRNSLRQRE